MPGCWGEGEQLNQGTRLWRRSSHRLLLSLSFHICQLAPIISTLPVVLRLQKYKSQKKGLLLL